jgi:asparaginyl-tRNA synthetase
VLQHNREDLDFLATHTEKGLVERLEAIIKSPFQRISYTEAVVLLEKAIKSGAVKFENPVSWGVDLAKEHETYLTDKIFMKPTMVFNYPRDIKSFYMRLNEDGKTVAAVDVLVPKIGEIIGGSQREERLEFLEKRMQELILNKQAYEGYLALRRFGTVVHSGFGLGFERLVMYATGTDNIRGKS